MTPELDAARARRYLLGQATDEERDAIELEYFHSEDAIDRMAAAEDDLIDDYLSNRLDQPQRDRFEREYLASPGHRRRVETVRALIATGSREAAGDSTPSPAPMAGRNRVFQMLALAAALILVVAGSVWMFSASRGERGGVVDSRPPAPATSQPAPAPHESARPPSSSPAAPRVFAVSIPPVSVRSGTDSPGVIVPEGTDLLAVHLEGERSRQGIVSGRATIRTVGGDQIWQGPAAVIGDLPPGVIARIDVPPASLPAGDYVVTLLGTDGAGTERERARYFLRVRAR
jgi:hypothetical protein